MTRGMARVDANQQAIVAALRAAGCSVWVTSALGGGGPDLTVGFRGATYLLEVKDGAKPPSRRALTPAEQAWHAAWRGQVAVVASVDEALAIVGAT